MNKFAVELYLLNFFFFCNSLYIQSCSSKTLCNYMCEIKSHVKRKIYIYIKSRNTKKKKVCTAASNSILKNSHRLCLVDLGELLSQWTNMDTIPLASLITKAIFHPIFGFSLHKLEFSSHFHLHKPKSLGYPFITIFLIQICSSTFPELRKTSLSTLGCCNSD